MTSRDRTILLGLAVFAAVAGFLFFAIKPKRDEVRSLNAQIAGEQSRLEAAQTTLTTGLRAKAGSAADRAAVAELGQAVPADDNIASLLYELDAVSRSADVDFRALNRGASDGAPGTQSASSPATAATAAAKLPPGAVVGTAGLATLPFTLDFTGSFFDLEHFVGDVQDFVQAHDGKLTIRGRLLTIDGVSLVPDANKLTRIKARIAATAYLSSDSAPASADTATGSSTAPAVASTGSGASSSKTTDQITESGTR
jgi:Tfp pilus assembly protein PilO